MIPRRYVIAGLGIFLAIVLAVVLRPQDDGAVERTRPAANVDTAGTAESEAKSEEEFEGEEGRGGATEAQEEAEVKEKRLEALAEAKAGQVRPEDRRDDCAGPRLGRLAGPELELRRLGARGRDRPEGALHLPPHDPLRGVRLRRALPHSLDPAHGFVGRRRRVEPASPDLPVRPVKGAVRPDHRGRPEHRRGLSSTGTRRARGGGGTCAARCGLLGCSRCGDRIVTRVGSRGDAKDGQSS
jgi:hypothetical protein